MVKILNLKNYFDLIITFNDVKNAKPDPEAVFLVSNKLKVPTDQILIIGDANSDMIMGKSAGSKVCLFYPKDNEEIYSKEKVNNIKADYKISSLKDIIKIIQSSL